MIKLILVLSAFVLTNLYSQEDALKSFHIHRMEINQRAMLVLGSWAIGNIILGIYGNFNSKGQTKYFHQFNAMWNSVNLALAGFGYLDAINTDLNSVKNIDIIKEFYSLQNFLLLNAGLDVAYIATGFYLKERSKNSSSSDRLKGYGNSLLLQGGFLLLFDVTLFFIHQNNANIRFYPHLESLLSGGLGLGISFKM